MLEMYNFDVTMNFSAYNILGLCPVSLKKCHDIVILSFCNIVKGQANCQNESKSTIIFIMYGNVKILSYYAIIPAFL